MVWRNMVFYDADGGGNSGGGGNGNGAGGAEGSKTYSQAELDRLFGERASQAERSLLKKLGFEKAEDVQSALARLKDLEDGQKSEAEKLRNKLAELERTNTEHTRAHQEYITEYEIKLMAGKLGIVDPEAAYKLIDLAKVEYDEAGKPKNLEKVLKELVQARPYLLSRGKTSGNAGAGASGEQAGHSNMNDWIRQAAGKK
jgi:hypothetical protein